MARMNKTFSHIWAFGCPFLFFFLSYFFNITMSDYQQVSVNHHKYNYELDPDLIFNFDSQVVEYVYTDANRIRETNDIITLKALNLLDDSPQVIAI